MMTEIIFRIDGAEGVKLKRALEAFALEKGVSTGDLIKPWLRGIAQQIGLDASHEEAYQESALLSAENRAKRENEKRSK